jgi:hypothetical protein
MFQRFSVEDVCPRFAPELFCCFPGHFKKTSEHTNSNEVPYTRKIGLQDIIEHDVDSTAQTNEDKTTLWIGDSRGILQSMVCASNCRYKFRQEWGNGYHYRFHNFVFYVDTQRSDVVSDNHTQRIVHHETGCDRLNDYQTRVTGEKTISSCDI